jgi:fluoride exporter
MRQPVYARPADDDLARTTRRCHESGAAIDPRNRMLTNSLAVAAGGAIGSLARFWLAELFVTWGVVSFPWATLVANVSGSFLIGAIAALTGPDGRLLVAPEWRLFCMVGICGGYTTSSSFSLQTLTLAQGGEWARAAMNVLFSLLLCLLAVWLGYQAAAWLNRLEGT